jgi:hypothetical protein
MAKGFYRRLQNKKEKIGIAARWTQAMSNKIGSTLAFFSTKNIELGYQFMGLLQSKKQDISQFRTKPVPVLRSRIFSKK